ncbi:thioesterase II family protein [Tenacibaculum sp. M341]|uniref:thioesterase II family protein n=1 Tax=Tenacibaculum sp. M341 TaxID=2530339 RepID=UPI00104D205E|nr:thioesterase domain-containing protein [Tenacibaculum sp. M341]TCI84597.1 thioesterase [Tenacibaculum sp. M341]
MSVIKLFCFPYAGGSAMIYDKWKPYLDNRIELIPVELPGRGKRMKETFKSSLDSLIEYILDSIGEEIKSGQPYAFFGHSMGGLIVHQLLEKIQVSNMPLPVHAFFSGKGAPHIEREKKNYHLMDDETFKQELLKLGGTPPKFFEYPELVDVFLPLLRNDFKIADTEVHTQKINPKTINITAFFGQEERFCIEKRNGWNDYTTGNCTLKYFKGGHFFIHEETKEIVSVINNELIISN